MFFLIFSDPLNHWEEISILRYNIVTTYKLLPPGTFLSFNLALYPQ